MAINPKTLTSPVYVVRNDTSVSTTTLVEGAVGAGKTTFYWRGDDTDTTVKRIKQAVTSLTYTSDNYTPLAASAVPTLKSDIIDDVSTMIDDAVSGAQTDLDAEIKTINSSIDALQADVASVKTSYVKNSSIGIASGVASLGADGRVPSSQLPSYVDDVVEGDSLTDFPKVGEAGKIYVALDTNKTYRWSGSNYVEISASLAIGTTASTAFAGNRGVALETWQGKLRSKDSVVSVSSSATATGATITVTGVDLSTGTDVAKTGNLPMASSSAAGMITAAMFDDIEEAISSAGGVSGLTTRVTNLETWQGKLDGKTAISKLGNATGTASGATINTSTLNLETGAAAAGTAITIPLATGSVGGLVLGSERAAIATNTSKIAANTSAIEELEADVSTNTQAIKTLRSDVESMTVQLVVQYI